MINRLENNDAETIVPAVTVTFPPNGTVTRTDILTFCGTANDAVKVEINQNGGGWALVNGTQKWDYPVMLTEGSNIFLIKATSLTGITNQPLEWVTVLDESASVLTNYVTLTNLVYTNYILTNLYDTNYVVTIFTNYSITNITISNDVTYTNYVVVINFAVTNINHAPVADINADTNVFSYDLVTLNGSGSSDVDGDFLFYYWEFVDGPETVLLYSYNTPITKFKAPEVSGHYTFRLTVSDGELFDTNTLILYVEYPFASYRDFQWSESNDDITITNYIGVGGNVMIPPKIEDKPVTIIGSNAFKNNVSVSNITIPDSVKSIDYRAFYYCTSLSSITISDSVTSIGMGAFRYCTSLNSITIPDSITSIDDYTFYGCTMLSNITLPDSVTNIGNNAFRYCTSLSSITLPDSVTSIGNYAFHQCSSLTNIFVDLGNTVYKSMDGVLFSKDGMLLIQYPPGGNALYSIPDSVTNIGNYAFSYGTSLSSIIIPDSVTSIADYTFYGCTMLSNITLPDSVTSLGDYVFYYCTNLNNVTIPDSVTNIGNSAFRECASLSSVTINAVTPPTLGNNTVFNDNGAGRKFYVPSGSVTAYQAATYWDEYAGDILSQ